MTALQAPAVRLFRAAKALLVVALAVVLRHRLLVLRQAALVTGMDGQRQSVRIFQAAGVLRTVKTVFHKRHATRDKLKVFKASVITRHANA